MAKLTEFRQKEVINISDGVRMGFVCDIEINATTGQLESIVVPKTTKLLGFFGKENDYVIKWDKIKKIGDDIIIVDIDFNENKNQ